MSWSVAARMRKCGARWMGLICLIFCSLTQAQMSLPGSFAVSPSGAATYTIPIQVPPGVAGMEPKLALVYNSQAGNGLLGVGWNLSGLSAISRCPQTMAQDSARIGVNYTATDRYCLDGQRLSLYGGSAYGADGSEYRIEGESYSQIKAYMVSGVTTTAGPAKFVVKTKSGLTMEFGNTVDSRVMATSPNASVVRVWALSKIQDAKGNYMTVTYNAPDTVNGQNYPTRIDYGGNVNQGTPTNRVVFFDYDFGRTDASLMYEMGSPVKITARLTKISTATAVNSGSLASSASANLTGYSLGYQVSTKPQASSLNSLQQCSMGSSNCMPLLLFAKNGSGNNSYGAAWFSSTNDTCMTTCGFWLSADINGDGRIDLIHIATTGSVATWISTGDGNYTVRWFTTSDKCLTGCGSWQVGDVNGDGKADLIHLANDSGSTVTWLSNGDGTYRDVWYTATSDTCLTSCGTWQAGDFNGDGLTDLVHIANTGSVATWISTGDGNYSIRWFATSDKCLTGCGSWQAGDVNGDGKTDLIHLANDSGSTVTWLSNGDGTYRDVWYSATSDTCLTSCGTWQAGDFNGDGLTDLVHIANTGSVATWISTGDGNYLIRWFATSDKCLTGCGSWQVGDVNGDGKTDLIHLANDSGWTVTWLSNGDGSYVDIWYTSTADTCLVSCGTWLGGDINGDGKADLIHIATTGSVGTWTSVFGSAGLVSNITIGTLSSAYVSYSPLPRALTNGSYIKNVTASYPKLVFATPMYVVTSSDVNNGVGSTRTTNYSYGNLLAEVGTGRGSLGFQWMQTKDVATGLVNRTCYRQDHPYIGLVSQSVQGTSDAGWPACGSFSSSTPNVLSLTTNTYAAKLYTGNSATISSCSDPTPCAVAAGQRYFIYPAQSTTQSWDWDGTTFIALPQNRTSQTYDDWGNALMIKAETLKADGTASGYVKTTTSQYAAPDTTNWILGRVIKSSVQADAP